MHFWATNLPMFQNITLNGSTSHRVCKNTNKYINSKCGVIAFGNSKFHFITNCINPSQHLYWVELKPSWLKFNSQQFAILGKANYDQFIGLPLRVPDVAGASGCHHIVKVASSMLVWRSTSTTLDLATGSETKLPLHFFAAIWKWLLTSTSVSWFWLTIDPCLMLPNISSLHLIICDVTRSKVNFNNPWPCNRKWSPASCWFGWTNSRWGRGSCCAWTSSRFCCGWSVTKADENKLWLKVLEKIS